MRKSRKVIITVFVEFLPQVKSSSNAVINIISGGSSHMTVQ
jgi:hypothetical protein